MRFCEVIQNMTQQEVRKMQNICFLYDSLVDFFRKEWYLLTVHKYG